MKNNLKGISPRLDLSLFTLSLLILTFIMGACQFVNPGRVTLSAESASKLDSFETVLLTMVDIDLTGTNPEDVKVIYTLDKTFPEKEGREAHIVKLNPLTAAFSSAILPIGEEITIAVAYYNKTGLGSPVSAVKVTRKAANAVPFKVDIQNQKLNMPLVPKMIFKGGMDDSKNWEVEQPFFMADCETPYSLWYTVFTWAKINGYSFADGGVEGSSGEWGQLAPSSEAIEPVCNLNWREAMLWCNAFTQWYNAHIDPSKKLDPVYCKDSSFNEPITTATNIKSTATDTIDAGSQDNPYVNENANGFRLPTLAEWELAARYIDDENMDGELTAGEFLPGTWAVGATDIASNDYANSYVAWFKTNSIDPASEDPLKPDFLSSPIKQKAPNRLGIYDLSGNLWEFCYDLVPGYNHLRVLKGGCYNNNYEELQIGAIDGEESHEKYQNVGFRVCRSRD